MAAMTDALENSLIDFLFRGQAYTPPTTIYVALFTSSPADTGPGSEVSGNAYSRASLACSTTNWAATNATGSTTSPSSGSSGTTSNNIVITFTTPTGSWGTITHFGLYTAASGGTLLFWGPLSASKLIQTGDAVTIQTGQLQIQLDN